MQPISKGKKEKMLMKVGTFGGKYGHCHSYDFLSAFAFDESFYDKTWCLIIETVKPAYDIVLVKKVSPE